MISLPWRRAGDALPGGALAAAVLLQGFSVQRLAGIQLVLFAALGWALWQAYGRGLAIGRDGLSLALAAFWLWCLAAAALAAVPCVSWPECFVIGSLPLAYFALLLAPEPQRSWQVLQAVLALLVLAACAYSLYQLLALHQPARSFFVQQNSQGAFLNLAALSFAGVLVGGPAGGARSRGLLAALILLTLFVVAAGLGRGPALGLWVGLAALILLVPRKRRRHAAVVLLALACLAFAGANLASRGGLLARMGMASDELRVTLERGAAAAASAHPDTGLSQRFMIWRASLAMLPDLPWHGFGPGAFHVLYPAYSPPADASALQYAHNDYLQFLIELGWPGLALVLTLMGAVALRLRRAVAGGHLDDARRCEAAGLFAGMLALAVHSLVSYNLQIVPTLVLCGLVLARFVRLTRPPQTRNLTLAIARHFSRPMFAAVLVLGLSLPLGVLAAAAGASMFYEQARTDLIAGHLEGAERNLSRAAALFDTDRVQYARALLYTAAVGRLQGAPERRREVYGLALGALRRAAALNPYAAAADYGRARLFEDAPDLGGPDPIRRAAQAYRSALAKDPRDFRARLGLAGLLQRGHRQAAAARVLEAGLSYAYPPDPAILEYVQRSISMRRALGDEAGAERLSASLRWIRLQLQRVSGPGASGGAP